MINYLVVGFFLYRQHTCDVFKFLYSGFKELLFRGIITTYVLPHNPHEETRSTIKLTDIRVKDSVVGTRAETMSVFLTR